MIGALDELVKEGAAIEKIGHERKGKAKWLESSLASMLKMALSREISPLQIGACETHDEVFRLYVMWSRAICEGEGYGFTTDDCATRHVYGPGNNKFSDTRQSARDIEEAWKGFFEQRDEFHRNLLMENYLPLVKYTADRIYAKLPDKVELDDLISAGIFGLMDAIDAFDPERGVKFETYCTPRIRGAILDELRSMEWLPKLVRARAHHLERALRTLEAHLGRMPTEAEIAAEMNLDMNDFRRPQKDAVATGIVSLSNKLDESDGDRDIREFDIIENQKSQNLLREVQKRDLKGPLTKGLTRVERLIMRLYYYEEMTMKEIGAALDLSESRVSQMHSSIIARLNAQMNSQAKAGPLKEIFS